MEIKSVDLPSIGKKYTVKMPKGQHLVIIIHHTGFREIYMMNDLDDDEPLFTVEMNDEMARKIGSILMGADYQPVVDERVDIICQNIMVEWITLTNLSPLDNKTIKDARIRTLTGTTIIGIQRGGTVIGSPDITEVLRAGDILMSIGKKEQIKKLQALCKG
ncbi:MAG TPA: TrkA C-terminal domain-containing protein [Desulfosporosinus sp.]|nr:TrkA C-terminal domain-containing protein [Desulfosporosinus sp.]